MSHNESVTCDPIKQLMKEAKLKGITVNEKSLLDRFELGLSEHEWNTFSTKISKSWNAMDHGLEGVVVKHITEALSEMGYKTKLEQGKLKLKKQ